MSRQAAFPSVRQPSRRVNLAACPLPDDRQAQAVRRPCVPLPMVAPVLGIVRVFPRNAKADGIAQGFNLTNATRSTEDSISHIPRVRLSTSPKNSRTLPFSACFAPPSARAVRRACFILFPVGASRAISPATGNRNPPTQNKLQVRFDICLNLPFAQLQATTYKPPSIRGACVVVLLCNCKRPVPCAFCRKVIPFCGSVSCG